MNNDSIKKCRRRGRLRFTWPGENERIICEEHAKQIQGIAKALGFHQQFIIIPQTNPYNYPKCSQTEPKKKRKETP